MCQYFLIELLLIYVGGCIILVHFDAVRLRALRGPVVQTIIGLMLVINNFRVLVRERVSGARLRSAGSLHGHTV